ncbi:hypothetical protein [Ferroacidibacillus organovorans]|uniref:hypothetical protein n=1 Tax=Ferroacidibacillus organovorans TaxID=1765683 RepID=UPI00136582A3|nr:hypothetical protein [Ferroacidibacillus organovorans]
MTTDLLLTHYLKQLRLPTVAKHYASLAREATEHGLSYEVMLGYKSGHDELRM